MLLRILCLLLLLNTAGEAAPLRLRVLTYNIRHGEGTDLKLDLARTATAIQKVKPDVVALQEVDHKTQRTQGVDQAAELGKLTGMHAFFSKAIDYQGGGYGAAVLSRWPFKKTEQQVLPGSPGHEQRPAAVVEIAPEGGAAFTLVSIHLDNKADAERLTQARRLLEILEGRSVVILAGDFNARPESTVMNLFTKDWLNTTAGQTRLTIPAEKPARQIDFVLTRPKAAWRVVETEVIDDGITSDHRALLVVLERLP